MKTLLRLTGLAILTVGASASAQPATDLDDASRAVFNEAVTAAENKQWAVCRTKAVGVWQQIKHPKVAGILGVCEAELGMHRDASEHLDFFFANEKNPSPSQKKLADEHFAKARPNVALLTIEPSPGDADVLVNGTLLGRGPQRLFADPGTLSVTITKGGEDRTRRYEALAGATDTLKIELPSGPGPGGAGGVGGTGASPEGAGGTGGAGGADETPSEKALWPTILLGGIAAAGIGSGIGLSVAGSGAYSDAEEEAGCSPFTSTCRDVAIGSLDDAALLQNVGIAMFAVGGAAAIGAIVYLALPGEGPANTVLLPAISSDFVGLYTSHSF